MKLFIGMILSLSLAGTLFATESVVLNEKLTIYSNNLEGDNGLYTLSGDVHINNLLYFDDEVLVEVHDSQNSKITTDAKLYVKDDSGTIHYIKNYVKSKTYKAVDNRLVIEGSRFTLNDQVGGFDVFCENLTFDNAGYYLDAGYVPDFPGIVNDVLTYALSGAAATGNIDLGIQYSKNGSTQARCNVEDLVYVSPLVLIYDFNLHLDPGENVFGGGFTLQIPAPGVSKSNNSKNESEAFTEIFGDNYSFASEQDQQNFSVLASQSAASKFLNGIVVDMLFVEGAIESFTLGIVTEIPIGATGTKLTRIKGSASGLSNDKLKLSANVNIGTALDPLITLEDLGVNIKKGYISGGGELKIFKKKIASGKIYYSKKKKAIKVSGRLNLGGTLKGKVKAGLRNSKFSGSSKLSVNTPEIDYWPLKWLGEKNLGYAHASIHRNTRFRAKLKFDDVKLAIQAKYKSTYPYYKFYIGSNYKDLHRIAKFKNSQLQEISFSVDDNVKNLMLVAGNDIELFDFTATDPTGTVHNNLNTRYEQIDSTKQTIMHIDNPERGAWTFNTDQKGEIFFNALQINQPPAFMIQLPAEKASVLPQLRCSFTDYQDTVNVEFYYDTDNKDFDGTLINEFEFTNNATIDFNWDNYDIDNGEYYIYAVVDDGQNAPLMQYAPGSIIVNNWNVPAPENLTVKQTEDSALVRWTINNSPDILYTQIYVRDTSTGAMSEFTSSSDSVYITSLINGRLYEIWATYQNEIYLDSFASDVVSYTHLNPLNENNTPYFTLAPDRIITFQSGEYKEYSITAYDVDNDPLTFDIIDMPPGMELTDNLLSWTASEPDQGVYNLKFTVSDGKSIDSVYHEIIVYNKEQAQISINYSSLNLYKGDNLYLLVHDLHNTLPEINCSWRNPFTGEDIGVELRRIDEFTYMGQVDLPEFPTSLMGIPVNFEDYPIVATYIPQNGKSTVFSSQESYTTSGIYNVNPQGTDEIPPAIIEDMNIDKLENNRLLLKWTATGDDGNTGKAYSYDLRYSYSEITSETEFNNSYQYAYEPYPQPADSIDSVVVDLGSLTDSRNHDQIYFSLKAIDESNNKSALGSSATVPYLLAAADVQYRIDDLYAVTLQWTGPSESKNLLLKAPGTNGEVIFQGYDLYRKVDNQDFKLIQSGYTANTYIDSLKNKPDGSYIWAVESVYNMGPVEKEYSDTLLLDRFRNISIVSRLKAAADFKDVNVDIVGLDTVYTQGFSAYSDSSGLTEFTGVFDSQYKITLHKTGYMTIVDTITVNGNSTEFSYLLTEVTGLDEPAPIPRTTTIHQNYPNPFNSSTTIRYDLANRTKVRLNMYNTKGQLIKILINREQNPGTHQINFNSNDLSSGLYFIVFKTEDYQYTLKTILLK